jgi:hypothetical protein
MFGLVGSWATSAYDKLDMATKLQGHTLSSVDNRVSLKETIR